MTMNTAERIVAARALDAATLCEAFQVTAATCPQRVALRTPGDEVVVTWEQYAFAARGVAKALSALCGDQRVLDEITAGSARANAQLSLPEQIRRWKLLDHQWLPGGDELTPTMTLQRRPIAVKYAADIEALYQTGDRS